MENDAHILQKARSTSGTASCTPAANVLVIYEDGATHRWAGQALSDNLGSGRNNARTTWWRMSDLEEPAVLAGAVSSALRANLIIVAVRGGGNFPLPFYFWASSWVPHRTLRGGMLVGLIGSTGESRAREYLAALGRQAGFRAIIEERALSADKPAANRKNGVKMRAVEMECETTSLALSS